jgi:hypothetical protein
MLDTHTDLLVSILNIYLKIFYFFYITECSGSTYPDPGINGVSNCMSWAAYVQSTGGNFTGQCINNPQLALKCCFTCRGII